MSDTPLYDKLLSGSSRHFIERCVHGTLISQCRCPGPNKSVRTVACPPQCDGTVVDVHLMPGLPPIPKQRPRPRS